MSRWLSPLPTHCDLCAMKLEGVFIDGKTLFGPWAIMCKACHEHRGGVGLGVGRGQMYDAKTGEKLK